MKDSLTFHTETLQAQWFRALPPAVRVFWMYLLGESDTAGWWEPEWDVIKAWMKLPEDTPLDPNEVERLLVEAGKVKVHPSGWWELTEYMGQQYPRGLSDSQGFQRAVKRKLEQHQKRESAFASKATPTGPVPQAGVEPAKEQEPGGGGASGPESHGSPMVTPSMADACKTQDQGHCAPGPRAQDPGHSQEPKTPTGGPGGDEAEPATYEGQARELALSVLVNMLRAGGVDSITEPAKIALGDLLDAEGQQGAANTLKHWHAATRRHSVHSLVLWLQDRREACGHPDTPGRRRWWTATFSDGWRQKHWRCLVCGHHESYGDPFTTAGGATGATEAEGVAA